MSRTETIALPFSFTNTDVWEDSKRILAFTALMVIGAKIRFYLPYTPIPFTFQTFFVLLAGVLLGARLGTLSQALYLALGVAGLPVFSGGAAGLAYLFGPTGGYLIGFALAPIAVGSILRSAQSGSELSRVRLVFALSVGVLIIHLAGMSHLAVVTGGSFQKAFIMGAAFIPVDALKACGVAYAASFLRR